MKLLALDTSSDACSVALAVGDRIADSHVVEPRKHMRILVPMIEDLLQKNDVSLSDLDAIVLGNGPGSFIGMRIGASVAQGIAFGSGLKIVPVSSLAAIAAEVFAEQDASCVLVAQDARMGEVYLARFLRDAEGLPYAEGDVRLHKAGQPIPHVGEARAVAAGAGWHRYPELQSVNASALSAVADCRYPKARFLMACGIRDWDAGRAIAADEVSPEYVRLKVAEKPPAKA